MERHHDRVGALIQQGLHLPVDGLDLVGKDQPFDPAWRDQAGRVFQRQADHTDRNFAVRAVEAFQSRSEEHTSELQSLMRISYAVFCLKKKKAKRTTTTNIVTHAIYIHITNTHL